MIWKSSRFEFRDDLPIFALWTASYSSAAIKLKHLIGLYLSLPRCPFVGCLRRFDSIRCSTVPVRLSVRPHSPTRKWLTSSPIDRFACTVAKIAGSWPQPCHCYRRPLSPIGSVRCDAHVALGRRFPNRFQANGCNAALCMSPLKSLLSSLSMAGGAIVIDTMNHWSPMRTRSANCSHCD